MDLKIRASRLVLRLLLTINILLLILDLNFLIDATSEFCSPKRKSRSDVLPQPPSNREIVSNLLARDPSRLAGFNFPRSRKDIPSVFATSTSSPSPSSVAPTKIPESNSQRQNTTRRLRKTNAFESEKRPRVSPRTSNALYESPSSENSPKNPITPLQNSIPTSENTAPSDHGSSLKLLKVCKADFFKFHNNPASKFESVPSANSNQSSQSEVTSFWFVNQWPFAHLSHLNPSLASLTKDLVIKFLSILMSTDTDKSSTLIGLRPQLLAIPFVSKAQNFLSVLHLAPLYPDHLTEIIQGADPSLINSPDSFGRTPIFYAVLSGNAQWVRLLVDYGAEVNIGSDDVSLLQYALINSSHDLVEILVEKVDLNAKIYETFDVIHYFICNRCLCSLRTLLSNPFLFKHTLLANVFQKLLNNSPFDADLVVDFINELHLVPTYSSVIPSFVPTLVNLEDDTFIYLLSDLDVSLDRYIFQDDNDSYKPIHFAVLKNNWDLLHCLLECEVPSAALTAKGNNILDLAITRGQFGMASQILEFCAIYTLNRHSLEYAMASAPDHLFEKILKCLPSVHHAMFADKTHLITKAMKLGRASILSLLLNSRILSPFFLDGNGDNIVRFSFPLKIDTSKVVHAFLNPYSEPDQEDDV